MGENSHIEWTDHTFNPWMGCTKVSEGCRNCYAERDFDHRFGKVQWGPGKPRVRTSEAMWRNPLKWNAQAEKTGVRPRVFSASLGDWLDPEVPVEWLADFMELIQQTPHLDWLLLTKRPEFWPHRIEMALNSRFYAPGPNWLRQWRYEGKAPKNVWAMVTVEDQKATSRIPHLLEIPSLVHGLSCEPMCGPLVFENMETIDWVICGGESGPNARPMHPDCARSLRDQCQEAEKPFFFKQWGEWAPSYEVGNHLEPQQARNNNSITFVGENGAGDVQMLRVGKKTAGRLLDGLEWNELPKVSA